MNETPTKRCEAGAKHTPNSGTKRNSSHKAKGTVVLVSDSDDESPRALRRSGRKRSPNKKYLPSFPLSGSTKKVRRVRERLSTETDEEEDEEAQRKAHAHSDSDGDDSGLPCTSKPVADDLQLLQSEEDVAGSSIFGFHTPKKRNTMALVALNTPKTAKTPKTPKTASKTATATKTPDTKRRKSLPPGAPKTPSHLRHRLKNQIAKILEADSESDFSADGSEFEPSDSESSASSGDASADEAADDEPKTPHRGRRPIVVPVLPKTPSAARLRQTARSKNASAEYVPESDGYFQAHASSRIHTSDHTLDRLKNPRLPADRLFSLLAEMTLPSEHADAINAMAEEYRSYFPKWVCTLHEGFNLLLYGLGSKRQLLQSFHRQVLAEQTVLVVNGFFPSLTLKDILDSIIGDILDAGPSPANPHEAVDMIEEEFCFIPDTHLYLIVHNLDGTMLRNAKAQSILARLASMPNIHLLASIDHINTPLLWDHTKLRNFNFSWWDCTTMLPYSDETAYENSLLVQNSGELALSSMRSVFSSLTANSRGIYMLIVKHQLKQKGNPNYQGMPFKDLYWSCREAFLVSSDMALRAQLTEFLDHKLVKTKRSVDGTEQLVIPIDALLLQQFLDEQEKK